MYAPSRRSTAAEKIYAVGDFNSGLIAPIGKAAPLMPPFSSRHGAWGQRAEPASGGNMNPKGGVSLVPWTKIGGVDEPSKKVGRMRRGGLPRNSSCTFACVSQFAYIPAPPRTTHVPSPVTSQATPARGLNALGDRVSAFSDGRATPLAICS